MVKGYEVRKGEYVEVDDEELKKIAPTTATTMDILQFVSSDEVDPIFFQSSYYVAAENSTAKPYVLFMAALSGLPRVAWSCTPFTIPMSYTRPTRAKRQMRNTLPRS